MDEWAMFTLPNLRQKHINRNTPMKLIKIQKNKDTFEEFNPNIYIGNLKDVDDYLRIIPHEELQYEQLYQFLTVKIKKAKEKYESSLSDYSASYSNYIQVFSESNYLNNRYEVSNPNFAYNDFNIELEHRVETPQSVMIGATYPMHFLYNDNLIDKAITYIFGPTVDLEQTYGETLTTSREAFKNLNPTDNPAKLIMSVIRPPSTLIRHVNKRIKDWDIVHPPTDIMNCYVGSTDGVLQVVLQRKIKSQGAGYIQRYRNFPSIRLLHQTGFWNDNKKALMIKRLFSVRDLQYDKMFSGVRHWVPLRDGSESYVWIESQAAIESQKVCKYLEANYDNRTVKQCGVQNYILQDKVGYFNSMVFNQNFRLPPYMYDYKIIDDFNQFLGFSSQLTNILTICQIQENQDNQYGFLHQIGGYKVDFVMKIQRRREDGSPTINSEYNGGDNDLLQRFNEIGVQNSNITQYSNPNNFMMRILPINGAQDFPDLKNNNNIGIFIGRQIFRYASWVPIPQYNLKNIYYPDSYHFQPNIQDYNSLAHTSSNGAVLSYYIARVAKSFDDFNFMYERYGQFLSYRPFQRKYYEYRDKPYIDVFSDMISQTYTHVGDGWYSCSVTLHKHFQGNSILSFMLNDSQSELVSDYNKDLTKISLKDVKVQKFDDYDITQYIVT